MDTGEAGLPSTRRESRGGGTTEYEIGGCRGLVVGCASGHIASLFLLSANKCENGQPWDIGKIGVSAERKLIQLESVRSCELSVHQDLDGWLKLLLSGPCSWIFEL